MMADFSVVALEFPVPNAPTHVSLELRNCQTSDSSLKAEMSQTILLAEDDDDLRVVMTYLLETLHFNVIACASAEIASEAFRTCPAVNLLMTDLQMPGRSGIELAAELTALKRDLPVLLVSASILPDSVLEAIGQQGWAFLSKPCRFDALASIIESLLRSGHALSLSSSGPATN